MHDMCVGFGIPDELGLIEVKIVRGVSTDTQCVGSAAYSPLGFHPSHHNPGRHNHRAQTHLCSAPQSNVGGYYQQQVRPNLTYSRI
jgi:hypothetical protein